MEDFNFDLLEEAEATDEKLQELVTNDDRYKLLEMINLTTLDERQKMYLSVKINRCEFKDEYDEIFQYLVMNIIERKDRIAMGMNYNMTDIKMALRML